MSRLSAIYGRRLRRAAESGRRLCLKSFKNGRASISLGYIGIHETINALFGDKLLCLEQRAAARKGIAIVWNVCRRAVDQWKRDWLRLLVCTARQVKKPSVTASAWIPPSSAWCRAQPIKGITTLNKAFHLDVRRRSTRTTKSISKHRIRRWRIRFHLLREFEHSARNLKALEDVWDYSYQHVPYYGTNTPIDECYECGFTGELNVPK